MLNQPLHMRRHFAFSGIAVSPAAAGELIGRHRITMLAIFDIDGTICDTQEVEGVCYARAIERVTGRPLSTLDWTAYDEPTSSAIVRDLLVGDSAAERKEEEIKAEFVRLLE